MLHTCRFRNKAFTPHIGPSPHLRRVPAWKVQTEAGRSSSERCCGGQALAAAASATISALAAMTRPPGIEPARMSRI